MNFGEKFMITKLLFQQFKNRIFDIEKKFVLSEKQQKMFNRRWLFELKQKKCVRTEQFVFVIYVDHHLISINQ